MAGILQEGIRQLINQGLVEMLVFALIFVLIYAVQRNVGLFVKHDADGKKDEESLKATKKIHAVIAAVIAVFVILPHHYAPFSSYDIIPIIEKSLPQVSLIMLAILSALVVMGMVGIKIMKTDGDGLPIMQVLFVIIVIVVGYIFLANSGRFNMPRWLASPEIWSVIIAVLVFGLVITFIMGPSRKKKKMSDRFKDLIRHSDNWIKK